MTKIVLLDTGPLGAVTHPRANRNREIKEWLQRLLRAGCHVIVPEIADYELRRELIRANLTRSIGRLDDLKRLGIYVPLNTSMMLRAAELWAQARQAGQPTASDEALDADVILAAQASLVGSPSDDVVIATMNVGHLSRFAQAELWNDISTDDC
jgi:predicted nucleic acid-binding protein